MVTFPKLARAPIHEALIDVRVKAREGLLISTFDELKDKLSGQFPSSETMSAMQASIHFDVRGNASTKTSETGRKGLLFKSADGRLLLQCRNDGMTVNRLAPYTSFEDLFGVFETCWNLYSEVARPSFVVRLGLRYINRFPIPPKGYIENYVTCLPKIVFADSVINGFSQQTRHSFVHRPEMVILRTALEASVDSTIVTIDVDAFRGDRLDTSLDSMKDGFDGLRELKNDFFFSVLGSTALEDFE